MRHLLVGSILLLSIGLFGQSKAFSIQFEDLTLDEVLDLVTSNTGNFFSYNSDIVSDGSKFTMRATDVSIDEFLNNLLVGTGLQHQVFEDQIILTIREVLSVGIVPIKNVFTISGRVLDGLDKKPIPGVNVFLSGTNLGGVSDLNGYYRIDDVPFGSYEIIFSHLSYFMDSQNTELFMNGTSTINSELSFKSFLLDSIEIVSKRLIGPVERRRYLRIFRNEFLGRTKTAVNCEIENPQVLDFIYDPNNDKLEVFSLEPLKILNKDLGYEIVYYFDRFQKTGSITDFYGRARFRDLKPESERQKRKWLRNRKQVYYGSFLHFRRALVNDQLKKENFRMMILKTDNLSKVNIAKGSKVETNQIIKSLNDQKYLLNFDGFLLVTHKKRPEETYVQQFFDVSASTRRQHSLLSLNKGEVVLKNNGRMELPGVSTFGYWYWERLGDLLPENYDPESDKL
ncbi:MAG: hypothetical protein GY816_07690 [Cytophagales bacterium]|nr:hypothetical protein [Cytophagales bacterium]